MKINRVTIQSAGPVKDFTGDFAPLTLIYGPNERGKTTVIEHIIGSLFADVKDGIYPHLRGEFTGTASIAAEVNGRVENFTLGNKKKTLNALFSGDKTVPKSLLNLLYVRAGDLSMGNQPFLKSLRGLISNRDAYDAMEKALPGDVKYTQREGLTITGGENRGNYKKLQEVRGQKKELLDVMGSFVTSQSAQQEKDLLDKRDALEKSLEELITARNVHAGRLHHELLAAQKERDTFPIDEVRQASEYVSRLKHLDDEIESLTSEAEGESFTRKDLQWLLETKELFSLKKSRGVMSYLFFAGVLGSLVAAILFHQFNEAFLLYPLAAALVFLAGLFAALFTGASSGANRELQEEIEARYDVTVKVLPDLSSFIEEVRSRVAESETIEGRIDALQKRKGETGEKVNQLFMLAGMEHNGSLQESIARLNDRYRELDKNALRLDEELKALGVDRSDYLFEGSDRLWSRQKYDVITENISSINKSLDRVTSQLTSLRTATARFVDHETALSGTSQDIFAALNETYQKLHHEEETLQALILAAHIVKDKLDQFRSREEREMEMYLNDPLIKSRLEACTGYSGSFVIQDDGVLVETPQGLFNLDSLSSGAYDQVMLALRIGIAQKICRGEKMFLLLDDVFQFTDWKRREGAVASLIDLVTEGWQVVYFTMDDHVKEQFEKQGKSLPQPLSLFSL